MTTITKNNTRKTTVTVATITKELHFKWTISKGRDTYGYNICTLYVDNQKEARCNGGGYDMKGTALGEWLQKEFQDRLLILFKAEIKALQKIPYTEYTSRPDQDGYRSLSSESFCGAKVYDSNGFVTIALDGGCGYNSIEKIANAIGVRLKWNPTSDRFKNSDFYTATIDSPKVCI